MLLLLRRPGRSGLLDPLEADRLPSGRAIAVCGDAGRGVVDRRWWRNPAAVSTGAGAVTGAGSRRPGPVAITLGPGLGSR
ncbi:MAG: hypothetical protein AAGD35_16640 [Actinomycetota bacterium]